MGRYIIFPVLFFCSTIFSGCQTEKSETVLQRFNYNEVRLTGGMLKHQLDKTCTYYLNIPNNDLLKGFRERVNLPTHGAKDMGGWYSNDVFHAFGQYLSGLSRLYAATGNEQCKVKVSELIDGWAETIEPDGYFFYTRKPNAPHYVYEKMQAGLLDAYLFTGNTEALNYMSRITDWAIENLDKERSYPYKPGKKNTEWYTLSENLYRAYEVTGDQKYFDFANFWEYPGYWRNIRDGNDIVNDKVFYHAYSHLNCLSGAAMAYQVKKEEQYLNTIIRGYEFFTENQAYITGGFGPTEQLVSRDQKQIITNLTHHTFETQCGSWAAFKLSKYLLEFTGNGMYGDWIEKLLINGIGASIPMSPTGAVMYYSDYNCKHATKHNYNKDWSCCTGTHPQAVADYVNLIYFKDHEGVYVNYFTPSTVEWDGITLEQQTGFPEEAATRLTIHTTKSKKFTLRLRKPRWLEGEMTVTVNGEKMDATEQNGWVTITRRWKKGDQLEAGMPMSFYTKRIHPDEDYPVAMAYGPVVLAATGDIDESYPLGFIQPHQPGENLIPDKNTPMVWQVKDNPEWQVQGFYQLKENQPYVMYVDPMAQRVISTDSIQFSPEWNPRSFFAAGKPGATLHTNFSGKGIRVFCYKSRNGGQAGIEIDGKDAGTIDLYGEEERRIHAFDFSAEKEGEHQVKVTILPGHNGKSSGTRVVVAGFEEIDL